MKFPVLTIDTYLSLETKPFDHLLISHITSDEIVKT
jgi:hypothetical protein